MVTGVLVLRGLDALSLNMLFANQIDLFQRYAGLTDRGAQQVAQWLSALSCAMPAIVGSISERRGIAPLTTVRFGGLLKIGGLVAITLAASDLTSESVGRILILVGLGGAYTIGYGAIVSSLPIVARSAVEPARRAAFMQTFFAVLALGGLLGIFASGLAEVNDAYSMSFACATVVLTIGVIVLQISAVNQDSCRVVENSKHDATETKPTERWPLLALVPFYLAYAQWTTSWYVQAQYMDRRVFGYLVPVVAGSLVERIVALTSLLLFKQLWEKNKFGFKAPPPLKRLGFGCLCAAASLVAAGILEIARRDYWPRIAASSNGHLKSTTSEVSDLGIVWLLPQFFLIAVAEAVVFPAQTEWASSSPELVGLACAVQAVSCSLLGIALPLLPADWIPAGSPNGGHYENYFFAMALLGFISAVAFASAPQER